MSSAEIAVKIFRTLETEDLSEHEFVPKEQVAKFSKLNLERDVDFRITRLNKLGLIYQMRGAYVGYTLNYAAYDCLAINALVKGGILEAFGKSLGVGKEADVFDALDPKGERIAVKFHRLGRISFRATRRSRGYTPEHAGWLHQSRLAAEKEYRDLSLLYPCKVSVPKPISQNRHVVAMGMIEGAELANWRRIPKPCTILMKILRNVRKAYLKAGVVHADLSEYNIMLKPNMGILIIDWPQYVTKDHPNAQQLLARDVQNVLEYFRRKHKLAAKLAEILDYVTGKSKTLTL
jgi:RIO kinase 2